MLTDEIATTIQDMTTTTIQDINQIIVLIYALYFPLPVKKLYFFLRYQLIVIND